MTKLTDTKRIDADLRSRYEDAYEDAKEHGWEHWIDDAVPVTPALKKFYMEFCHKHKDAGFYIDVRPIRIHVGKGGEDIVPVSVYNRISISFAQAPEMVVGGLMVEADIYTVESPRISNKRFKPHNPKYNRKSTKNFVNAIKTAKQYIKAFSFEQVRSNAQDAAENAWDRIRSLANDKLYQIAARIPFEDVLAEARAMMAVGYKPTTGPFVKLIELFETKGEELNHARNYTPGLKAFVWILNDRAVYQYDGDEMVTVESPTDMPQELVDRISVLQIGNADQAIIDVGVKVDDTKYWLFL